MTTLLDEQWVLDLYGNDIGRFDYQSDFKWLHGSSCGYRIR